MRRPILLGLALFLLCGVEARADRLEEYGRLGNQKSDRIARYGRNYYKSHSGEVYYTDRGKRGRKYARRFSLRGNLRGDKKRIYDEFGYTPHRLGYKMAGKRTERWKYHSLGVEFLFDDSGKLLKTSRFPPVGNHID